VKRRRPSRLCLNFSPPWMKSTPTRKPSKQYAPAHDQYAIFIVLSEATLAFPTALGAKGAKGAANGHTPTAQDAQERSEAA
jgi:hypothetical protein